MGELYDVPCLNYGTSYIGFNLIRLNCTHNNSEWDAYGDGAHNGGATIYGDIEGNLNFANITSTGSGMQDVTDCQIRQNTNFIIKYNGNVCIGTTQPDKNSEGNPSLLTVHGSITAEEVFVQLFNSQDIVFKNNYKLPTLESVENFIKQNKHLPGIPGEEETNKGINLSEMNSILLKKVEELTLYVIQLKKEVDELKKK